jgi:hypothetical protein
VITLADSHYHRTRPHPFRARLSIISDLRPPLPPPHCQLTPLPLPTTSSPSDIYPPHPTRSNDHNTHRGRRLASLVTTLKSHPTDGSSSPDHLSRRVVHLRADEVFQNSQLYTICYATRTPSPSRLPPQKQPDPI